MRRYLKYALGLAVIPAALLIASSVTATSEGQIEGGDIYRIKNVTKNVDFTDPANADACDDLTYKVRIHNPGPGGLTSVTAKATLPTGTANSHTSTMTVSAINADPASTSDTAVLNLSSSRSIAYVPGSTQLLDAHNGFLKAMPDGITQGGINIGNVGVSIEEKRFVQFKVKVNCPEPPKPEFACKGLSVTQMSRTEFDFVAQASVSNASVTSYVFTARNSSGNVVDTKTVTTSALTANYRFSQETAGTYSVSAVVNTDKGSTNPADCTKTVKVEEKPVEPKPSFACKALDVVEVSRTRFDFTAKGEATNAVITSYVFTARDSSGNVVDTKTVTTSATSASYSFERSESGTYSVSAVVNTDKGSTNPADCVRKVTVKELPPAPAYECKDLKVTVSDNRKVTADVTYTAVNGATLKTIAYDFGDGTAPLVTNETSAEHTYAKGGSYTITTILTFNIGNGQTSTDTCSAKVEIETPETPEEPVVAGKETLPNTGAGGVAGAFAGISALGAVGHYVFSVRRRQ